MPLRPLDSSGGYSDGQLLFMELSNLPHELEVDVWHEIIYVSLCLVIHIVHLTFLGGLDRCGG